MSRAGKAALVKISLDTDGTSDENVVADEAMTITGGATILTITDASRRVIAPNSTVVIETSVIGDYSDVITQSASDYTLNRLTGVATFDVAIAGPPTAARIDSLTYLDMNTLAGGRGWSLDIQPSNLDITEMEGPTVWIKRLQGLKDASGSIDYFWADERIWVAMNNDVPFCLQFFTDGGTTPDFRMWAVLASGDVSSSVDGLVEGGISFEGYKDADSRVLST